MLAKRVSIHEGQAGLLSSKTARFACKCVYRADPPPHAPTNINGMFHGAEAAVLLTLSSSIRVSSHEVQRSVGFHRPMVSRYQNPEPVKAVELRKGHWSMYGDLASPISNVVD